MAFDRKAVLWDVDGTLVDSEPLHEAALVQALHDLGLTPPVDFHRHIIGRDAREIYAWCRERLDLDIDLHDWLRRKYQTYFVLVAGLEPRSGAVDLFHRLRAEGYAQAIVSNSDRLVVNANLDAVGLAEPGLISISRNDVREGKPAPEPYLRAAWLLNAEPADCLVVEDSVTGAQAGLDAGMRTLFWPQRGATTAGGATTTGEASTAGEALTAGGASTAGDDVLPEGAEYITDLAHLDAVIGKS